MHGLPSQHQGLDIGRDSYQLGVTKVFIRNPVTVFQLEEWRERKVCFGAEKSKNTKVNA